MSAAHPERPATSPPAPGALAAIYDPILPWMDRVNEFLAAEFRGREPFIHDVLTHVAEFRGKQIRPACVFLAGLWCGDVTDHHVRTAAVIELIHTATLVHDDVLDDATLRRRVETVNKRWGERCAVLLGDYLYSRAFTLAAEVPEVVGVLADTTHTVCRGELLQVSCAFEIQLTEERYSEIIRQKTAVLYALACALGARLAGADQPTQQVFHDFGERIGMAFQIADDALDLIGDPQLVGKTLGSDLRKGKLTLPLIRLREHLSAGKLEEYLWLLQHPREVGTHQRVLTMLRDNRVLEGVRATAEQHVEHAIERLEALPDHPLRGAFEALARFVIDRSL